jgi:class 3 adenylate cyclase/type II secretory pathway predicted ATPase ExeA
MTPDGERRYITLMDVDLVGSTAIDVALGQERAADVKLEFRRILRAAIEANFGTYRSSGDGVFAEFGLTHGLERPVLAAVRAAQAVINQLEAETGPVAELAIRPQARFGIHCGLTLIRPDERGTPDYFGTTPDVAARLQGKARPNEILLSEDAYASVRHYVTAIEQPPMVLKGIDDPLAIYSVDFRSSPIGGVVAADTPFVGRVSEVASLHAAVEAQRGAPHPGLVQVVGAAGIGKTRLLRHFRSTLVDSAAFVITCDALSQGTSLAAVSVALAGYTDPALSTASTVAETLEVVLATLGRLAPSPAVGLLLVDDAQFADPSTVELLRLIMREGNGRTLVVVGTREPLQQLDEIAGAGRGRCDRVVLEPLEAEAAHDLVLSAVGGDRLSAAERLAIVARAAGVPLYLRELAFAASVREDRDWREVSAIPAGLWPALEARLANNRTGIDALRTLSLFEGALPIAVALTLTGGQGSDALREFESAQFLHFAPGADGLLCGFTHDLLRTAVYEGIAPRGLPSLHRATAELLIEAHPEFAAGHPHVVARQFELAGSGGQAAEHYCRAGDLAQDHGAYLLAETHYQRAFLMAEGNIDDVTRIGHRLIRVQMINHGFGDTGTVGVTLARLGALR